MSSKSQEFQEQKWEPDESKNLVFYSRYKKDGSYGLTNMAPGFPLKVNDMVIRTSEALYQAMKFPDLKEVQMDIIGQRYAGRAIERSRYYDSLNNKRTDWDKIKVDVMRWCLHIKLAQNWDKFSTLLFRTGELTLIEGSPDDRFWGAVKFDKKQKTREGVNMLGRLLMELRQEIGEDLKKDGPGNSLLIVNPPAITNFRLNGRMIETIDAGAKKGGL